MVQVTHLDDHRVCTQQPDGRWTYGATSDGPMYCDRDHDLLLVKSYEPMQPPSAPHLPADPEGRSWDEIDVGDVLEGTRPGRFFRDARTARGVLVTRLADRLDEQTRLREAADLHRRYAEQCEDAVERLEREVRELEDAARMLTDDTPQPDRG